MELHLHLNLKSDATFGRGDGVAGLVDEEIEHDANTGLPFVRGRTLKGLLVEECANILYALGEQSSPGLAIFEEKAGWLFGKPGSKLKDDALMHVGAALLPEELRQAVEADLQRAQNPLTPADVLASLTAIRRQTAIDEETGAPDEGSLRAMRVALRETPFITRLDFDRKPDDDALALLAACALSLRRGGTGRNRGRGRLEAWLCDGQAKGCEQADKSFSITCFEAFKKLAKQGRPQSA